MDMISVHIKAALQEIGINNVEVMLIMHPAWTTDWIRMKEEKIMDYIITHRKQGQQN